MSVQALPGIASPGTPSAARPGRGRAVGVPAGRRVRQPLPMQLGALRLLATAVVCALVVVGLGVLGAVGHALWAGDPAAHSGAHMVRVQPGESLVELARRAVPGASPAVAVRKIEALNDLDSPDVPSGRSVLVPAGS